MVSQENENRTKQRILDTAKKIFAEKGYNGARIDHIAAEAKVNKALIYYYFKSKEAIKDELFKTFFRESTEMLLNFVKRGGFLEHPEENKEKFEEEYMGYLAVNRDLLTIIFMESLITNEKEIPIFKLIDLEKNVPSKFLAEAVAESNITDKEEMQIKVTEFFTGVIPSITFLILKEKWCAYFGIKEELLNKYFDNAMEETHEQYHKNRPGKVY